MCGPYGKSANQARDTPDGGQVIVGDQFAEIKSPGPGCGLAYFSGEYRTMILQFINSASMEFSWLGELTFYWDCGENLDHELIVRPRILILLSLEMQAWTSSFGINQPFLFMTFTHRRWSQRHLVANTSTTNHFFVTPTPLTSLASMILVTLSEDCELGEQPIRKDVNIFKCLDRFGDDRWSQHGCDCQDCSINTNHSCSKPSSKNLTGVSSEDGFELNKFVCHCIP